MFRFKLAPYNGPGSRKHCPKCKDRRKTFVPYIDTQTGEPLGPDVGRCNREDGCGHHRTPKQHFAELGLPAAPQKKLVRWKPKPTSEPPPSCHNLSEMKATLASYERNHLVQFIEAKLGPVVATKATEQYFIGTAKKWPGTTVFWQVDANGRVRAGKLMLYNPNTGKRVKDENKGISWVHTEQKRHGWHLQQCFFGEHLLAMPGNEEKLVCLVESEKTAVVASGFYPDQLWLATSGKGGLNIAKFKALQGRRVMLFPDAGLPDVKGQTPFTQWAALAANELRGIASSLELCNLLESDTTTEQKAQGFDLADFLLTLPTTEMLERFPHLRISEKRLLLP